MGNLRKRLNAFGSLWKPSEHFDPGLLVPSKLFQSFWQLSLPYLWRTLERRPLEPFAACGNPMLESGALVPSETFEGFRNFGKPADIVGKRRNGSIFFGNLGNLSKAWRTFGSIRKPKSWSRSAGLFGRHSKGLGIHFKYLTLFSTLGLIPSETFEAFGNYRTPWESFASNWTSLEVSGSLRNLLQPSETRMLIWVLVPSEPFESFLELS